MYVTILFIYNIVGRMYIQQIKLTLIIYVQFT